MGTHIVTLTAEIKEMNAQYSQRECLEEIGIPNSVKENALEAKVLKVSREIDVEMGQCEFSTG